MKKLPINFFLEDVSYNLRDKQLLRNWINQTISSEKYSLSELNFIFCSDDELLEINQTHLNHDYYTDIITFDLSEKDSPILVSDIYISVDRVKDNAANLHVSASTELHRVIFHGILHLIGYKDKTKGEKIKMTEMEGAWLNEYLT